MSRLLVTVLLCVAAAAVPAAATMLGAGSGAVAAGRAAVTECDDAQTVTYQTQDGLVTSVTIGAIADPACSGGRLSVTLTAAGVGVASGGPVTVPSDPDSDDDSVTVTVTPGTAAAEVDRTDVLIEDPS